MILILCSVLLMSCGIQKKESADDSQVESSRVTPNQSVDRPIAYCNQAVEAGQNFKVHVAGHFDVSGQNDPNLLHVKITDVAESFATNNEYFALWKWYGTSDGATYVNPKALSFKIINIQSSEDLTGFIQNLSWKSVASMASSLGASTPAQFFQKVRLYVNLEDPQAQYDALTVGLHDEATGAARLRVDALIPLFFADPRAYAVDRAKVLIELHPFSKVDYSQWTAKTFSEKTNEFCSPMFQY